MSEHEHPQVKAGTPIAEPTGGSLTSGLLERQFTSETSGMKSEQSRAGQLTDQTFIGNDDIPVSSPPIDQQGLSSPGTPLDASTRVFMETHFAHDFGRVSVQHQRTPAIQPKLFVGRPGDSYELEADRVASQIMHVPDAQVLRPAGEESSAHGEAAARRACSSCGQEGAQGPVPEMRGQTSALEPAMEEQVQALRGGGQRLPAAGRSFFEPRFGYDFSRVRIHSDARAAELATSIDAQAFTIGRDIFFGDNQYNPSSISGRRLLAHELTHVVQQNGNLGGPFVGERAHEGPSAGNRSRANVSNIETLRSGSQTIAPSYDPGISRTRTPYIMRQQAAQPQAAPQTGTPPPQPASGPLVFLQEMLDFVRSLKEFVDVILQSALVPPVTQQRTGQQRRQQRRGQPPPQPPQSPQQRAHRALNQGHLQQLINSAKIEYERQINLLPSNDPQRVTLRELYVQVIEEIRTASNKSLDISNQMAQAVRDSEQQLYAETMAQLIEASPMTSAGLSGTTTFQQADVTAGTNYEAALEHYLDDLLVRLPTLTLTQAQKDQIFERIQVALRRAFVTVAAGPGGAIDVRGITNQQIVDKYRRVSALLSGGISNPQQMSIITDAIPTYQLPNPVPNVSARLTGRTVDLSRVPPAEVDSVRFGIAQAVGTVFPATSTITFRNAYWPVALQVLRGGAVVSVRYELVFDSVGNVRAERLGEASAREVAPAFAQLSVPDKKAQLITDFGLVGVDDRPADPGRAGTRTRAAVPPRAAANWTGPELDQVKAAFDLMPQADRTSLNGLTLVRDHQGTAQAAGSILMGFHHTGRDDAHDRPSPPTHGPPHIHYYDETFTGHALAAVGAPGATGPGGDSTLLHEVGHARIALAARSASAAVTAANQQLITAGGPLRRISLTAAQRPAWNAWSPASTTANQAIVAFHNALGSTPPTGAAQQAQLLVAAQTAITARDAARPGLAAAGFSPAIVQAAANLDAANDALLAASQQLAAARDQVPIFVSLAGRFGFHRFTDYARTGATDEEWFAETYSLHLTDPNRLNQMSRNIFLWFEAGMPMDRNWNP